MDNSIRKSVTKGKVTVDSITVGKFQKEGTETAMLRQTVNTISYYPSAVHSSDMQENPFTTAEFGDEEQAFPSVEKRVAFIDVPEGTAIDAVLAKLGENATLYRTLSNAPILTDNHRNAINRGLTTKDELANSQVVRYPEGNSNEGELILDPQGRVQYRKVFFWTTTKEDIDLRGHEDHPEYKSEAMKTEIGVDTTTGEIPEAVVIEDQSQVII